MGNAHARGRCGSAGQCGVGRCGSAAVWGGVGVRGGEGAYRRLGVAPVARGGGARACAAPEAWGDCAQLGGGSAQLWGMGVVQNGSFEDGGR